ncbi:TPA: Ig-like domain-containing protein, partial [Vibrio parahaemolyticus]|nr:Ig-like domain-containing protein [Vibrio parahaemolyticus]
MNSYFKALFLVVLFPLLTLIAGCNSEYAFSGTTIKLVRIDISASPLTTKGVSPLTLAVGNKQPFEAVGHYSDGSSRILTDLSVNDWHTSNSDIGRFDEPGVFTATNEGNTTVTATKDGITSNMVDVNVSAAVITSIQVTPSPVNVAKGQTQQLTATAIFSDATSSDISSSVTWTPVDTATATVSSTGLLSGVQVGNTTLTATKDGITSNTVDVN